MPSFDHFNFFAPFYDRVIQPPTSDKLLTMVGLPISGFLLDAGGGTGRASQSIQEFASSVVVADLSFGMLQQASAKNGLETVCSHTECLPFPDGAFERVIMVDALHHVCNQVETASELWRVVKKGGRIVIEEPDIRTFSVKVVALAEKLALMRSHFLSPQRIQGLFPFPNAYCKIEQDGVNAWIIVDKE